MKRMRLLSALCAALVLTATTASAEDVTSKYLHNPGFELCEALTAGTDGVENDYSGTDSEGNTWTWNHTKSSSFSAGGVLAYGSGYYVGNKSYTVPSTSWDSSDDNKNALGVQARWQTNYSYYDSEEMTLPAGVYTISVHYYNSNTNSGSNEVTSYVGFVETSGTTHYASNTTFTSGSWQTTSVTFTLTEETAGTVRLGYYHPNNISSDVSPELFFDDVTIDHVDLSTSADITSSLLSNADFSEGTLVTEGATTYDYDMSANGVEMFGLQAVTGWTANEPSDNTVDESGRDENARAGGLFAYGSAAWLGSSSYGAPSADPDGSAEGNALGLVTVWGSTSIYASDTITLPAGYYSVTIPVYNGAGTGSITNYTGFVSTDGNTTAYASSTTYTVGEWTTETIEFNLTEATEGQFQFGFSSSSGSSSSPHLFYDGVTVESTAEAGVGVVSIDYDYDSDTNSLGTATVTFRAWGSVDEAEAKALADKLTITLSNGTDAAVSYDLTPAETAGVYTADLSSASLSSATEYTLTVAAGQYGFSEELANQDGEASFTTRAENLTLTIGSSGWTSTYYSDYNLTIPDGVTAYTVEVQEGEEDGVTALATAITGTTIPKATPVLLAGSAAEYTFSIAATAAELSATNDLKGSDAAKVIASSDTENYYYKFSLDSSDTEGSIGFYWYASDGHSYTATAHKAYLVIEAGEEGSEVKSITFVVNDGQATAISSVNTEEAQAAKGIYTLTGIRLGNDAETLPAGLYIINGKKTLIK